MRCLYYGVAYGVHRSHAKQYMMARCSWYVLEWLLLGICLATLGRQTSNAHVARVSSTTENMLRIVDTWDNPLGKEVRTLRGFDNPGVETHAIFHDFH